MEPDFYQYTATTQSGGRGSNALAASVMSQFVTAIKQILPNAAFSMDHLALGGTEQRRRQRQVPGTAISI